MLPSPLSLAWSVAVSIYIDIGKALYYCYSDNDFFNFFELPVGRIAYTTTHDSLFSAILIAWREKWQFGRRR